MLCSLTQTDFGAPDPDDHELSAIHTQFGHLVTIAGAHYGIQGTNSLSSVSHTAIRSMQRDSFK